MIAKSKFKTKGTSILDEHLPSPQNMREFLSPPKSENPTAPSSRHADPHFPKDSNAQIPIPTAACIQNDHVKPSAKDSQPEADARLHIHIRKELADKLFEMVYVNKRDKKSPMTQRAIIEQALEDYFNES